MLERPATGSSKEQQDPRIGDPGSGSQETSQTGNAHGRAVENLVPGSRPPCRTTPKFRDTAATVSFSEVGGTNLLVLDGRCAGDFGHALLRSRLHHPFCSEVPCTKIWVYHRVRNIIDHEVGPLKIYPFVQ